MYPVSNEYTDLMDDESSVLDVYVEVDFGDGAIVLSGEQIEYIDFNERVNDNSNVLTFGCACAHSVTIRLREPPELQYKGLKCKPRTGIMMSDGTIEWVPLGTFWVDTAKTTDDYKTVMITAYDKMYYLSGAYTTSLVYPALIADVVAEFEALAGVNVVEPEEFPAFYIEKKVEDGKYSLRDIAGHLAGCLGRNATFNRDGDMEFTFYNQSTVQAFENLQYLNGFEKLADNALKVDFLVTGQDGEIELENDGTNPGEIIWATDPNDVYMLAFTYDDENLTASVALAEGYTSYAGEIEIPARVWHERKAYTVITAAASGFRYSKAKAISIPSTITTIGASAFRDCTAITSITIPNSVTSFGASAFCGCTALQVLRWNPPALEAAGTNSNPPFYGCKSLTTLSLAPHVTVIPSYLLRNSSSKLDVLNIPEGIEVIGTGTFSGCSTITELTIPSTVKSIGGNAFGSCSGMKTIYWNSTLMETVGTSSAPAFYRCNALDRVVFAPGVTVIPNHTFREAHGPFSNMVIHENITKIGDYAFCNCDGITHITIPAQVTYVGRSAFYGCAKLVSAHWCPIAMDIAGSSGDQIFESCSALQTVTFADNVEVIPAYLLDWCGGVTSIVLPDTVHTIKKAAFCNCSSLTSVQIGKSKSSISSIASDAFGRAVTSLTIYAAVDSVSGSPWGASNATINWMGVS